MSERYPLKITGKHDPKKIAKRTKIRPFIKVLNYNHLLPTRYTLDIESLEAKKVIRKALEERHKASKNQWFFTKLGFSMRQKILIDTTNIAIDCFVIKKKKKKKTKEREEYGCTDVRTVRDEDLFFSVLNEDVDKKDSDTGLLQRNCAISKGGRDRM